MAATAVYARVTRIPLAGVATEDFTFSNIAATPASFTVMGGRYAVLCKASTYGTVTLQMQAPDNSTYLTVTTAFAADGVALVDLPPGLCRLLIA